MAPLLLALCALASAPERDESRPRVGLEVAEVDGVSPDEALVLLEALSTAVERAARADVLRVASDAAPCPTASPRCARVIPDLVEARLSVRVFGGLSMVRIDAAVSGAQVATARSSADVPRDPAQAEGGLSELARALFPVRLVALAAPVDATTPPPVSTPAPPVEAPAPPPARTWTWLVVGAGAAVALGATGVAFGVSSASARADAEVPGVDVERFEVLADRAQAHGWAANILFVGAALGLAAGVVMYAAEP